MYSLYRTLTKLWILVRKRPRISQTIARTNMATATRPLERESDGSNEGRIAILAGWDEFNWQGTLIATTALLLLLRPLTVRSYPIRPWVKCFPGRSSNVFGHLYPMVPVRTLLMPLRPSASNRESVVHVRFPGLGFWGARWPLEWFRYQNSNWRRWHDWRRHFGLLHNLRNQEANKQLEIFWFWGRVILGSGASFKHDFGVGCFI